MQSSQKTIVQGVAIIDIHSINKQKSVQILLNPQFIKQSVLQCFWEAQEEYQDSIIQEEEEQHNNNQQNIKKLEDHLERANINEDNMQKNNYIDLQIPTHLDQNPLLIPFTLEIKWSQQINFKYLFAKSHHPQDRCHVTGIGAGLGEFTMTTSFWLFDQQLESQFQEIQKSYIYKQKLLQLNLTQQSSLQSEDNYNNNINENNQEQEQDQEYNIHDIEITESYYQVCYKEIMFLGGGSFGRVSLYYDRNQNKLFAVKQLLDLFKDPIDINQNKTEFRRLKFAIKNPPHKANDQQIEGLSRNIIREIKVLNTLNLQNDRRGKYINKLEGVILPHVKVSDQRTYKTVLLVFEFFGGWESTGKNLCCDIYRYFNNQNNWQRFNSSNPSIEAKRKQIKEIFFKIYQAVGYLHENNVMIRDLKDDNILIKRSHNPQKFGTSSYEIMLIDFGLAKKSQDLNVENTSSKSSQSQTSGSIMDYDLLNKQTSILYLADTVPSRHPIYRYTEPYQLKYDYKDDIYALGVLLLRLHNYFQLMSFIDEETQLFVSKMTGLSYDMAKDYLIDMISKRTQDASEGLQEDLQFSESNLLKLKESRSSIQLIKDTSKEFIQKWLQSDDVHLQQGDLTTLETMESDIEQYIQQKQSPKKQTQNNKNSPSKRKKKRDLLFTSSFSQYDDMGHPQFWAISAGILGISLIGICIYKYFKSNK